MERMGYQDVNFDVIDSSDEQAVISKLEGWFTTSKSSFSAQRERWRKNERLYYNEVPFNGTNSGTRLKFALPLAAIETEMPIIADYLPTFDVMPKDENDQLFAEMMQKRKTQVERKSKLRKAALEASKDSMIYSNGLTHACPTLKGKDERGVPIFAGFDIAPVDVFTWFPSKGATGFDLLKGECQYHIFATPTDVGDIKRIYGKDVAAEGNLDDYRSFKSQKETGTGNNTARMALVKECYWLPSEETEKYPYGRCTIWANGIMLEDAPLWEGYANDDPEGYVPGIPYFMIANYRTAHKLIGIGETELVATQTKCLNEIMSGLADVIRKTGNPIRKVLSSWVAFTKKKIMGIPGEEVEVQNMGDIAWEQPPQIPAFTFNFIEVLLKLTDVVTGVYDVLQGKKPIGITAASAIQSLQETAQARVRFKISTEISEYMENMGNFIVWGLQQYDRKIRMILNRDKIGNILFDKYDPITPYDANGIPDGAEGHDPDTARTMMDSNFDIEVVMGTRINSGRAYAEERAIVLFEKGIYGIERVVAALNESNKSDLIDEYNQRTGLKMLSERQVELVREYKGFQLIMTGANDPQKWVGSKEEERAAQILQKYPDFLATPEFRDLSIEFKDRLLKGFMLPVPKSPAGDLQTPGAQGMAIGMEMPAEVES